MQGLVAAYTERRRREMHALGVLINHAVADPQKLDALTKPVASEASIAAVEDGEFVERWW